MMLGMFTANFMDRDLETVFKMMAALGYEAAELPAFFGNTHLDIEEVLKPGGAKKIKDLAKKHSITVTALSNHTEGQLVLGPHTKDTDSLFKGTPQEKIKFGMERMKKTAKAAAALDVRWCAGSSAAKTSPGGSPGPTPRGGTRWGKTFPSGGGRSSTFFRKRG